MLKHKTTGEIKRTKEANFDPQHLVWWIDNGEQFADPKQQFEVVQDPPIVTKVHYKMLFTSAERIATRASTDPVIIDLQDLLNDPKLDTVDLGLKSISDALDYMTYIKLIAPGRKAEILTGIPK